MLIVYLRYSHIHSLHAKVHQNQRTAKRLLIFLLRHLSCQHTLQLFCRQAQAELSLDGNADASRLLAHHYGNGIRVLRDTHRSPVTQSQLLGYVKTMRHWQYAPISFAQNTQANPHNIKRKSCWRKSRSISKRIVTSPLASCASSSA